MIYGKNCSAICLASLLCTAAAQAQTSPAVQNLQKRVKSLEKAYHRSGNPDGLLAPGPFFQADVLFWQARETGLSYAIAASNPLIEELLPRDFAIKELEYEWDFGFRLGAGFGASKNGWEIGAVWTHFVTDAHDKGLISSSSFFLPIWSHPDFTLSPLARITEAEAHWQLYFNTVDIEIGRAFYVSKYFALRPFIGPSIAWIDQHYHVEYEETPTLPLPMRKDHVRLKNYFYGVGARLGCELRYHISHSFSLLAKGSGAIYSGVFNLKRKDKMQNLIGPPDYDIKQDIEANRAATAIAVGFMWEHGIQDRGFVRAQLTYDIQFYFKQNQMPRFIAQALNPSQTFLSDQGDLSLQGGCFSLTIGY